MNLILSMVAGLAGSVLGGAVRAGVDAADRQLRGEPQPESMVIVGSPTAGVAAGVLGILLGVRRAFWLGAVLSAAGSDRLDVRLLGRMGIDMETMMARAKEAATRARASARGTDGSGADEAQGEG